MLMVVSFYVFYSCFLSINNNNNNNKKTDRAHDVTRTTTRPPCAPPIRSASGQERKEDHMFVLKKTDLIISR